jgi:hypothetical protein
MLQIMDPEKAGDALKNQTMPMYILQAVQNRIHKKRLVDNLL